LDRLIYQREIVTIVLRVQREEWRETVHPIKICIIRVHIIPQTPVVISMLQVNGGLQSLVGLAVGLVFSFRVSVDQAVAATQSIQRICSVQSSVGDGWYDGVDTGPDVGLH
jgi:hypothetical protein